MEQAFAKRLSIKRLEQAADKTAAKVCDGTIRVKGRGVRDLLPSFKLVKEVLPQNRMNAAAPLQLNRCRELRKKTFKGVCR